VSIALGERGVRGIILDIEGTTTPVAFVYDVLFPYARAHLRDYLRDHVEQDEAKVAEIAARMESLMDRDVKDPELKALQGKIWVRGYGDGTLKGQVFPDVPPALERWHAAGLDVAIYSSGSVLAQRLLFGTTPAGDLTKLIGHYFDTGVGPKRAQESYARIASELGRAPRELLFISDVVAELDAARAARVQAALCVRPGNAAQDDAAADVMRSFDEIAP
jgi:enolase-phosphatase E1